MLRSRKKFRPEKDQVIGEGRNEGNAIRIRIHKESEQQKRARDPREPFDPDRQNKKDVNDFLGIKMGKGEE